MTDTHSRSDFDAAPGGTLAPANLSVPLQALWWAARDEWDRAHALVQDASGPEAAWVHAHLHRAEGDDSNAAYWYRRAGKPAATGDLAAERRVIAAALRGEQDA